MYRVPRSLFPCSLKGSLPALTFNLSPGKFRVFAKAVHRIITDFSENQDDPIGLPLEDFSDDEAVEFAAHLAELLNLDESADHESVSLEEKQRSLPT